ncbi:hypothetical protein D9M70_588540 [compost metagenome]
MRLSSAASTLARVGLGPARRNASTSTLAEAKPSSAAGDSSPWPLARASVSASFTIGWPIERSLGNTCVTITPRLASPSCLMKPDEALFDSVTTCAAEPAARSALMPSTTATPEPIHTTACASAFMMAGTMVL